VINRQNIKVKNADGKKDQRTKRKKEKCQMGKIVEWKKRD
jgi:hypothetical protein